ncbi:MAG: hypothetical protein Q8P22_14385 [Chloroflexota bacterium]|nr:hypothetical protein [Chloroflexota bacterium]
MTLMNRWLASEVAFVHVFHGALYVVGLAIVAINVDADGLWVAALALPLVVFSLAF